MPQPDDVSASIEPVLDVLRRSEARILAELEDVHRAIVSNPALWRRRGRLEQLLASVRAEMTEVRTAVEAWRSSTLPEVAARGALDTGLVAGTAEAFALIAMPAVEQLAERAFDDILAATEYVEADAKRWWRDAVRAATERAVLDGQTPTQVARELARAAPQAFGPSGPLNIRAVQYADGSLHSLREYTAMVTRTTTAQSYNAGAVASFDAAGVQFVEVFDGADCGATSHDDPDKVNGTVRPVQFARDHPIAHPNCLRAFGARFDVTTEDEAREAVSLVDPERAADQARSERKRAERQGGVRAERRQRAPRQTRQPRAPRA